MNIFYMITADFIYGSRIFSYLRSLWIMEYNKNFFCRKLGDLFYENIATILSDNLSKQLKINLDRLILEKSGERVNGFSKFPICE